MAGSQAANLNPRQHPEAVASLPVESLVKLVWSPDRLKVAAK